MLFDTHCHLTDERFSEDIEQVIANMRKAQVELAVNVGDGTTDEQPVFDMAARHPGMYAATGVHPQDALKFDAESPARLRRWMSLPKAVALGEIGLDYYYDNAPHDVQLDVFLRQLVIARELKKPVIMHIRDGHGDALALLRAHRGELPAGVMHCFSGSVETAREYLDMGFYISIAGPVTFKNAAKLPEVSRYVPADRLLVETDSPYLAPVPKRSKRNEPAFVQYTAAHIAELRGVDAEAFAAQCLENGIRLFGIDPAAPRGM
jgi:TatD DNase family protein